MIGQTTEASFDAFGLNQKSSQEKAVLRDHLYFRGRLWDLYTFEIERRDWMAKVGRRLEGFLLPG